VTTTTQIRFDITIADYIRSRLYQSSGSRKTVATWCVPRLMYTIILLGFGLAGLVAAAVNRAIGIEGILFSALCFGSAVVLTFAERLYLMCEARQVGGALGPHEVEISDEFLTWKTASGGSLVRWTALARIEYLDGDIYYASSNRVIEVIPCHAFASADEAAAVFATMIQLQEAALRRAPAGPPSSAFPPGNDAQAASGCIALMEQFGPALSAERLVDIHASSTIDDKIEIARCRTNQVMAINSGLVAAIAPLLPCWSLEHPLSSLGIYGTACLAYAWTARLASERASIRNVLRDSEGARRSEWELRLSTDFTNMTVETPESIDYFSVSSILRVDRFSRHIGVQLRPVPYYSYHVVIPVRAFTTPADACAFGKRLCLAAGARRLRSGRQKDSAAR